MLFQDPDDAPSRGRVDDGIQPALVNRGKAAAPRSAAVGEGCDARPRFFAAEGGPHLNQLKHLIRSLIFVPIKVN
jgi:hypothetical protein